VTDHEPLSVRLAALRSNARSGRPIYRSELTDLSATASDLERRASAASLQVYEPPVYGPGSGHSFFADMMRAQRNRGDGDGGPEAAAERLRKHEAWQHRQDGRRLEAMNAEAEMATRAALSQTPAEAALLHRWEAAGGHTFEMRRRLDDAERRGLTRTPGQGGAFVPPAWVTESFIHAPRAGAPFAALWRNLTLPGYCDSVNLPRFTAGAGSGIQASDDAPQANRDPLDGFYSAQVRTLSATIDMPMQWLDQTPIPPDQTIGVDLAEDFMTQLDGLLLLGNTSAAQPAGIIPGGTFSAANLIWLQDTNNTAAQSWANGGGGSASIAGSLHQMTAQLRRKIARYRALPPTHWIMPDSVWDIISGSGVDSQVRPLVPPGMHHPSSVPMLHGLPVVFDENVVETFGGAIPPYMSTVSAGRYSPTDGNGTWVPIIAGRWSDCLYWQSEPVISIMEQVLSGSLMVRFQARCYIATAPGRVVWGGSNVSFSGTNQGGGVNAQAPCSFGAVTNFVTNSILQPASAGF
jgi:HK97 family phage major capsid protein